MTHSSQIIIGDDLSIGWSASGLIASFTELGIVANYALSLQWQVKDTIPVGSTFTESAKLSLKTTLNLSTVTDREFEMPEYVWIKIGLLIKEFADGSRFVCSRTARYLLVNDSISNIIDDTVTHQYSFSSQERMIFSCMMEPASNVTYWKESIFERAAEDSWFGSSLFIKIL